MPSCDDDFYHIKRELVEEIRGWKEEAQSNVKALNKIMTGGDNPENGFSFRLKEVEDFKKGMIKQKQDRDKQVAGIVVLLLTGLVTFLGDMVSRLFFHTK